MVLETIDISNTLKGVKFLPPSNMHGKLFTKLGLEKQGIRPVALKHEGEWLMELEGAVVQPHSQLFCIGEKDAVSTFIRNVLR